MKQEWIINKNKTNLNIRIENFKQLKPTNEENINIKKQIVNFRLWLKAKSIIIVNQISQKENKNKLNRVSTH
jgi:hypothetical protein